MSIALKVLPMGYTPVYNQVPYVLTSTQTAQPNFKYKFTIMDGATLVSSVLVDADPNGYGIFDIHKHLESLISYDLDHDSTDTFLATTNSWSEYNTTFSEVYDVAGVQTTFTSSTIPPTSYVHNAVIDHIDFITYSPVEYITGDYKFLTTIPNGKYDATVNNRLFINTSTMNFDGYSSSLTVKAYKNGLDWEQSIDISSVTTDKFGQFGVGPWNINNNPAFTAGTIDTDTDYYTFQVDTPSGSTGTFSGDTVYYAQGTGSNQVLTTYLPIPNAKINDILNLSGWGGSFWNNAFYIDDISRKDDDNQQRGGGVDYHLTPVTGTTSSGPGLPYGNYQLDYASGTSEVFRVNIIDECTEYEVFQLLFLDRKGSFVSTIFDRANTKDVRVKKTTYTKNIGGFDATNISYGYNSSERGKTRLNTEVDETITINSNWDTEEMSAVVDEMIASPEVYHLKEDGTLLAINILTSNYKVYQSNNSEIHNHQIKFEYAYKNAQQR
jgi:hypothetical protein